MKTSPKRSYSVIENERFGLVFAKTVSIISGTAVSEILPEGLLFQHQTPKMYRRGRQFSSDGQNQFLLGMIRAILIAGVVQYEVTFSIAYFWFRYNLQREIKTVDYSLTWSCTQPNCILYKLVTILLI